MAEHLDATVAAAAAAAAAARKGTFSGRRVGYYKPPSIWYMADYYLLVER